MKLDKISFSHSTKKFELEELSKIVPAGLLVFVTLKSVLFAPTCSTVYGRKLLRMSVST